MFRTPRETRSSPSVGRAPTPPGSNMSGVRTAPIENGQQSNQFVLSTKSNSKLNRSRSSPEGKTNSKGMNGNRAANNNGNILSFFKKVDNPSDQSLFVGGVFTEQGSTGRGRERSVSPSASAAGLPGGDNERYNESGISVKRRRLSNTPSLSGPPQVIQPDLEDQIHIGGPDEKRPCSPPDANIISGRRGPFVEQSESEGENEEDRAPKVEVNSKDERDSEDVSEVLNIVDGNELGLRKTTNDLQDDEYATSTQNDSKGPAQLDHGIPDAKDAPTDSERFNDPPSLKREATSVSLDVFGDFGYDDYADDEYAEGEEYMERRFMEEQRRLEEQALQETESGLINDNDHTNIGTEEIPQESASCPVCGGNLDGLQNSAAQVHVNGCLDGKPTPLPAHADLISAKEVKVEQNTAEESILKASRFQKAPRPPKPGQGNPFSTLPPDGSRTSAFSRLMSSHAEDEAWATAAASENAARGKPAYQRTCPFYKILPGFSVCVDAFRYGAVEGCRAYFLSHFHSDHYVGLTASWQHGPIYCSKVTGNLVRQQLRVDPRYVMDLEFEVKREVPGTNGVTVTMLQANHCPGSSLFLFEKAVGPPSKPRTQRVLHCGDFRACPEHLRHPLLRPDITDPVSGRPSSQRIDVCYLDTTYLNPRYAFPSQENVIRACADMCVSLKKERVDDNDEWEQMKKQRGGSMAKFVQKQADDPSVGSDERSRGRLLVVVGTYSIGKERICIGVAKALKSKIFASGGKQKICACLEDPELDSLLTTDPHEAQVHMTPLFEIRAETLQEYLNAYKPHFSRVVGFRPSGWTYRPPNSRFIESPSVATVLHSSNWRSPYSMSELVPQRGSTNDAHCFGVPYSEHSSFRELTMFCCALRIEKVIPTVNVGSARSRDRMKGWIDKWANERRKNGVFQLKESDDEDGEKKDGKQYGIW